MTIPPLGHLIERNARLFGSEPAVWSPERRLTHGELADRVRRCGAALRSVGLRPQERFSVLSMNNSDFVVCYYAAFHAGFILNTLNYRLAPAEIRWVINDASPRLLIFEAQYAAIVAELREHIPSVDKFVCIGEDAQVPSWATSFDRFLATAEGVSSEVKPTADDLCCLMYTSGTTGKPKGVVHANRSMSRLSEAVSSELGFHGKTRLLAIAPLFHMGAASMTLAVLFRGGCVVLHRGFDAKNVIQTIARERISAMHMVPTMVQAVLDEPELNNSDLSSLKMLMYAAAPMPLPVLRRAVERFGAITYNGYGQTEINFITILHPHQHILEGTEEENKRLASVGQTHWQCEIDIVNELAERLPPGSIGEVIARSETAMSGYWNNTTATLETIRDGWIHTGDVGYIDADGYLYLVDRKRDVIISGGENVYSREVENALASHAAVYECAVIGVPHQKWGEVVKAVVVVKAGTQVSAEDLIGWCKKSIASYKAPKMITFVERLPRLDTGKISKNLLRSAHLVSSGSPD